jgi:hypothetical protein
MIDNIRNYPKKMFRNLRKMKVSTSKMVGFHHIRITLTGKSSHKTTLTHDHKPMTLISKKLIGGTLKTH